MNSSLIIRALMHAGFSYAEAVQQSSITLESDSKIAVIRLVSNCTASPKPARQSFCRRFIGGINRF